MQSGPNSVASLRTTPPPPEWGVQINDDALSTLTDRWARDEFPLPAFDYAGTPSQRDESWWFDYATVAVSVLACLWAPEGDQMWRTEFDGEWLDDAPGIFAVFTRLLNDGRFDLHALASIDDAEGAALFAGQGTLQLIDERVATIRNVATATIERWDGSIRTLVDNADRHAPMIVNSLIETVPGYYDRPTSSAGTLRFDKLAHLATAIMAAGVGWADGGFTGFEDFPVYPDYMLPRVFRHFGVFVYSDALAAAIDSRELIGADSPAEHALRWATIYAGARLQTALREQGAAVTAPALDYRLWSEAVLGPNAGAFGEHHRTISMAY